jgi:hypothetical protein
MHCSIVTPRALRWLANGHPARILNLFEEVCNIADDSAGVVSLVSPRIGPGPFTLILHGDFTKQLEAYMAVAVDPYARALTVGPMTISTDRAALWNPRPDWQAVKRSLALPLPVHRPLVKGIEEPLLQLIGGIKSGNKADCRSGAHRLAGLGNGLTPSGDDVLMGVLFGLWVWYPYKEWMHLIIETAMPRTTTLSAAFLAAAADGEATVQWHYLARGRENAIDQILAMGSTSGHDAWTGFTYTGRFFRS